MVNRHTLRKSPILTVPPNLAKLDGTEALQELFRIRSRITQEFKDSRNSALYCPIARLLVLIPVQQNYM